MLQYKTIMHGPRTTDVAPMLPKWILDYPGLYKYVQTFITGTRYRSCLRHCATSRKVAISIPDGVIGIFIDILPL